MAGFSLSRRDLMTGGLSIAGLSITGLTACSPRKDAKSGDLSNLTLRVATYRGNPESFFTEAGVAEPPYKLARSQFAGGNLIVEAINARALDFGGMSEIPPIFVAGHPGNQVRIVGVLRGDVNNQVVLLPKGSPVKDFSQLKGKRIGYVKATTSHYILLRLLEKAGLAWSDITPVALSPQDGLAAFQSGALDAWVIYGVIVYQAREAGARVLTTAQGILSGNYLIAASKDALDDPARLAAIGDYVRRYRKVFDWINADGVRWARVRAQATGIKQAYYEQEFRERSTASILEPISDAAIASQQAVADTFAAAKIIPARVEVKPLWDDRLTSYLK
ncbi:MULTISPECIES: ABC transporter substrate-binding protein [Caulobacter]|jgi:sulfonate transport system substrate-binding protein|uniref:ABC-type nitrate/sulfonate/bicarbonate transport system, periplasmic component n=1 Tax=Caulobacter vibrioides OR37 TaxID=1292034 RepID=R0EF33_CAUVI|nr:MULTISPECIES: ABC transporter substrate-binding protein [Caulobacter]ENZ84033.1 ABC-type nitrate/sulfonate/bicarbonate transport system, periplasmic component [Caulobacter vibrioides OR37]MBQ1561789.1 ABC transporter substrate-binding protein [Caulobacter sp.]